MFFVHFVWYYLQNILSSSVPFYPLNYLVTPDIMYFHIFIFGYISQATKTLLNSLEVFLKHQRFQLFLFDYYLYFSTIFPISPTLICFIRFSYITNIFPTFLSSFYYMFYLFRSPSILGLDV